MNHRPTCQSTCAKAPRSVDLAEVPLFSGGQESHNAFRCLPRTRFITSCPPRGSVFLRTEPILMSSGLLVGHEERFHPFARSVAELIANGRHPRHQLLAPELTFYFLFPVRPDKNPASSFVSSGWPTRSQVMRYGQASSGHAHDGLPNTIARQSGRNFRLIVAPHEHGEEALELLDGGDRENGAARFVKPAATSSKASRSPRRRPIGHPQALSDSGKRSQVDVGTKGATAFIKTRMVPLEPSSRRRLRRSFGLQEV